MRISDWSSDVCSSDLGNGLRGYGNMLIVNHDADFLSVYAHNKTLLAKVGEQVRQGQTIATMGNTGSNAVNLYFELRYDGKAVDALRYLPKRRSEEHTSELQSLMRSSYAVFCLKNKQPLLISYN